MRIALLQMEVVVGESERNVRTAASMVRDAQKAGADLALLPELWSTGYDLAAAADQAAQLRDGAFSAAAQMARECGLYVSGSLLESDDGKVFNTQTVHSPAGELLAWYRKIHLFGLMHEPMYLAPGSVPVTVDIAGIRAGLSICYDLRFPELFRRYALDGAQLMLVSAEWPAPRLDHWRTLLRSRAIENQCYVAACNRVGQTSGTRFFGHSMVVDPWGEVVVEGDGEENVLVAPIDIARVSEIRTNYPFLSDRRNGIYGLP